MEINDHGVPEEENHEENSSKIDDDQIDNIPRQIEYEMTNMGRFKCKKCDKSYLKFNRLEQHPCSAEIEKPQVECKVCKIMVKDNAALGRHSKIHSDVKKYTCHVCHKKFREKGNLTKHVVVHTNEKPYACDLCSYRTRFKVSLTSHLKTHSDERKFNCIKCLKRFKHSGDRNNHEKLGLCDTTDDFIAKPYACKYCDYRASKQGALTTHMKIHTHPKRYACTICGKLCRKKYDLKRHQETCEYHKRKMMECDQHRKTCSYCKEKHYFEKPIHESNEPEVKIERVEIKPKFIPQGKYLCEFCLRPFSKKSDQRRHEIGCEKHKNLCTTSKEHRSKCTFCEQRNYYNMQLDANFDIIKSDANQQETKESTILSREYVCGICSKICATLNNLNKHIRLCDYHYILYNEDEEHRRTCRYCVERFTNAEKSGNEQDMQESGNSVVKQEENTMDQNEHLEFQQELVENDTNAEFEDEDYSYSQSHLIEIKQEPCD